MKIALIQLTSGADITSNIAKIESLVASAAGQGAELVALPENAFYMRAEGEAKPPRYSQEEHPGVKASAQMAKKYNIWFLAGSISCYPRESGDLRPRNMQPKIPAQGGDDKSKSYNRSILFTPQGNVAAQYDKIHLFDVDIGDGQTYHESARFLSGDKAVVTDIGDAKLGMTVCYDLRFPQLFRALAKAGAEIISVPSAFTQMTGEAHWHVLLRARAIENGCFIIAPAQTGTHPGLPTPKRSSGFAQAGGRKTYGHSLIVDPWGKILADGGTEEGVVIADIDLAEVKNIRTKLPSLQHDRPF